jgi:hypothetical protein
MILLVNLVVEPMDRMELRRAPQLDLAVLPHDASDESTDVLNYGNPLIAEEEGWAKRRMEYIVRSKGDYKCWRGVADEVVSDDVGSEGLETG